MPTNQTQDDKDFEAIKAKIPFDDDDKKPEEPAPTPPAPPVPPETKVEEKTPVIDPKPGSEEEKPDEKPATSRPLMYIPIKQYNEEKKKWQGDTEAKDRRIKDLEKVNDSAQGSVKFESAVKKYAEKYDIDIEVARAEVSRFNDAQSFLNPKEEKPAEEKPSVDTPPEDRLSDEQKQDLKEAQIIKAEKAYDDEYSKVATPQIKTLFPNATQSQIESAKEEIGKLACTEKYLKQELDYIIFKEKDNLASLFSQDRKGPEPTRPSTRGNTSYTPQDFVGGKTPFTVLSTLSEAERDKIVKGFDVKTWDKFARWSDSQVELEVS